MTLSKTEAIRLALLEAIEFESPTASWLELELKDTLPAAGVASEQQVDRVLVHPARSPISSGTGWRSATGPPTT